MILAAAIAMAAMANAAAIGWTIGGASAYVGGTYSLFVVGQNGVTDVNQITSLVATGADVSAYAFGSGSVAGVAVSQAAATSGKSITYSGSGTDTYQAFAVLWNADATEASFTSTATVQLANDSTGKAFAFGNQATNLAANSFAVSTSDVPEPTSGLLLLLGVAGLALKRKRA